MKKLFFALALLFTSPVFAQTQTQYYTIPTIAALKALTSRPSVVEVVDANPGIFNLSSGACSAADDIFQVQPTSGTTVCYTRMATPYSAGKSQTARSVLTTNSLSIPSYITRSALTGTIMVDWYYSGSGSYDAAIAAAINACPSLGCAIGFSPGTYAATNIILSRGNIRFFCTGMRSCNIQNTSTTADLFAVNLTVATTTVSTNSGSPTVTVASASGISIGMQVNSTNIPAGTTITNIVSTTLTLSANATGTASGTSATFGNMIYDVYWDGFVFSSLSAASAGCQINARNLAYTGVSNSRFYGNETSWKHVCLRSVNDFTLDNIQSDNPQNAHLTLEGITSNGYGTLDGIFIGLTIRNYSYFIGGHVLTASPLTHGSIEVGDLAGGLFFDTALIARPRGYAIRMLGTSAGPAASANSLIFFNNLNIEGSGTNGTSGGVYANYYSNINVTGGWISGNGTPALVQGANSSGLTVVGAQLVVNGSSSPIVQLAGSSSNISGNRFQSYNPGVGRGVELATGISSVNIQGNHFEALASGIADGGLSNIDINIDGNQFVSTTTPIAAAIYTWAKATIGVSNSDANGPLMGKSALVGGDITISKTQNAPNSFVCLNAGVGASSSCRFYLQTGTANSNASFGINDSGGSPYAAFALGSAVSAYYQSVDTHVFTSQSGTVYGTFNSTGLVIDPAKALTYGGVTLSNAVTGTGNMALSISPTFTGTVGAADLTATGTLRANTAISANGTAGISATTTVRDSAGTGTCTLIFTFGIKTGGSC